MARLKEEKLLGGRDETGQLKNFGFRSAPEVFEQRGVGRLLGLPLFRAGGQKRRHSEGVRRGDFSLYASFGLRSYGETLVKG